MHKSKLAGFIIDCQTAALPGRGRVSGARHWECRPDRCRPRKRRSTWNCVDPQGLHIEVQSVTHPSRVHLDIETDDIEAEVRRLEALGARRVAQVSTWWVMEAPTGQRFCVVRVQSPRFGSEARSWPDP